MAIISGCQILDTYYSNHKYKDFRLWFRGDENYDAFLAGPYLYPWGSSLGNPNSGKEFQLSLETSEILQKDNNIVIISSNSKRDEILSEANRFLLIEMRN